MATDDLSLCVCSSPTKHTSTIDTFSWEPHSTGEVSGEVKQQVPGEVRGDITREVTWKSKEKSQEKPKECFEDNSCRERNRDTSLLAVLKSQKKGHRNDTSPTRLLHGVVNHMFHLKRTMQNIHHKLQCQTEWTDIGHHYQTEWITTTRYLVIWQETVNFRSEIDLKCYTCIFGVNQSGDER